MIITLSLPQKLNDTVTQDLSNNLTNHKLQGNYNRHEK